MLGFQPVSEWWARQGLNLRPHPCEGCLNVQINESALPVKGTDRDSSANIAAFSDQFLTNVAALFVETGGCYHGLPGVDAWHGEDHANATTTVHRDGREYAGPHPVVAHPPCKRWGRFWHGSTRKPHQFKLGDDGGCFAAALAAVRTWGGVLEHPADSKAWAHFNLNRPARGGGWIAADMVGGFTCYVEQGHYGHTSRKPTWLYAFGVDLPDLNWTLGEQRIPEWMIDRYGYEKARKIGVVAMMGGKDKVKNRNRTPKAFRDLLLSMARSVQAERLAA